VQRAAAAMLRASARAVEWRDYIGDAAIREKEAVSSTRFMRADSVSILEDGTYYASLPTIISWAQRSIRVCMFHVVFASANHPTVKLLNALVAAKQRGVTVKVVMDQDKKGDPYHSLIINTPAKKFLESNGIECRFDESDRLLHSKYLVIDDDKVVIGSHNWSAGSYFTYKDLSFLVHSTEFAAQMNDRFERQWRKSFVDRRKEASPHSGRAMLGQKLAIPN
jgi:phosphatidylserine/phosphatidylglycerophosphate/cardiolipin synthase-like enzyme